MARYGTTAILLHWTSALLVAAGFGVGLTMVGLEFSPQKLKLYAWHKWIGVTVFAVTVWRLGQRARRAPPPLPETLARWERRATHAMHAALYALLLLVPVCGWLYSSAKGVSTVYLGFWTLPDVLSREVGERALIPGAALSVAEFLGILHRTLAYTIAALVMLHASAAMKHALVDRDGTWRRMLPVRHSPSRDTVMKSLALALAVGVGVAAWSVRVAAATTDYAVVAGESHLRFEARQMNVLVDGAFRRFSGRLTLDAAAVRGLNVEIEVDTASLDLGTDEANRELGRAPWLDVRAFPVARFVARSATLLGPDLYRVDGVLTLKGVTRPVTAQTSLRVSNVAGMVIAHGQFPLRRSAFNVGVGDWADPEIVADEVLVRFKLVFAK